MTKVLPQSLAPVQYEDWLSIRRRVEEKVYPLLMRHQRIWAEANYREVSRDIRRAHFCAPAIELQWALSGVVTSDVAWFLARQGTARDIN